MFNGLNFVPINDNNVAIKKDHSMCAFCGHCLSVCVEEIGNYSKFVKDGMKGYYNCLGCGQCSQHCPERAITGRDEYQEVKKAINDPEKVVVFSISPGTRVGLGDAFKSEKGTFVEGEVVSALKTLGADYVLDVTFSADLTIMEEGTEFIKRVLTNNKPLPQFTSCCPAWIKYMENYHEDLLDHLSTAKSPIGMQGVTIKTYFAKKNNIDPKNIVSIAVTPCTAKKAEIRRPEFCDASKVLGAEYEGMRDNDFIITADELARWIKEENISFKDLKPMEFDSILGKGSGAGVIFANSGGVMEAALRMAYSVLEGKDAPDVLLEYKPARGLSNVKEAEVVVGGKTIRLAIIFGTHSAEKVIENGLDKYDFIEVMTCPGGCISGAGQPNCGTVPVLDNVRKNRIASLYNEDKKLKIRNSMDNPEIQQIYNDFYSAPLSELSEMLLHTKYGQHIK